MKKMIPILLLVVIAVITIGLFGPGAIKKISGDNVITSSQLEKAIDISQLSTAEFVYNGVAEKFKENKPEEIECYIAYNANVKVGIQMEDVRFDIDTEAKTVTPILPTIEINSVTLDERRSVIFPEIQTFPLKILLCFVKRMP